MPALNFHARFAALVESGEKRHTIRKRRKDGRDPKPGERYRLYTGMRTKACRLIREVEITSVEPITVFRRGVVLRDADTDEDDVLGTRDGGYEADRFAQRDGFIDMAEMAEWFDAVHGLPFEGLLILWRLEDR